MRPTLLLPLLLALLHTTYATSESTRFLGSCTEGCISCQTSTFTCLKCADDLILSNGACIENYVANGLIYVENDHFLIVDIDNDGVDIAVIVIFSLLAFVVYMGSLYLMQKEGWKALVPESKEETVKAGSEAKEHAKTPTPKGTPKSTTKGDNVIEMGQTELGLSPTPKSATPASPVKSAGQTSHRSKKTVQEEEEEDENVKATSRKGEEEEEEEEEAYYPTKKELATRNRRDQIQEEEEEEEDGEHVDIQVHDGDVHEDEDEQKTAQETPSPKTDIRSTPKRPAHKRKGSNHSDAEYEEDDNRPQVQSNAKHNQHTGLEGEDEEEEFESARSGNGQEHEEEEEEEQEEQEEEEEQEDNDVMDLNDLGLDHGEKKH